MDEPPSPEDRAQCFDGDCVAQPGTQLIGPLDEGAALPLEMAEDCIQRWGFKADESPDGFPSDEDGDAEALARVDPTRPETGYRLYSNTNYRPCDVREPGMARVCDVLLNGLLTNTAEECASACTCLSSLPGVACNAVTWVWKDFRREPNNCFPKFIEGVERDGTLPPDACAQRNEDEHYSLIVLTDSKKDVRPQNNHINPPPARSLPDNGLNEGFCIDMFVPEETVDRSTIALAVALPLVAIVLACIAVLLVLRRRRRKRLAREAPPYQKGDAADLMTLPATDATASATGTETVTRDSKPTELAMSEHREWGSSSERTSAMGSTVTSTHNTAGTEGKLQTYGALTRSSILSEGLPGDVSKRRQTLLATMTSNSNPEGSADVDGDGDGNDAAPEAAAGAAAARESCDVPMSRIVPPGSNASGLTFGGFTVSLPATHLQASEKDQLCAALDNVVQAEVPQPFAERYMLVSERKEGSQGVVQMARSTATGDFFAIKFFLKPADFEEEIAHYTDPVLQKVLPQLIFATNNADGAIRSRSGYKFPPLLILERGMTLREWVGQKRRTMEAAVMVEALAELLAHLHNSGRVHRDVKPDNILYLLQSTAWRLLDFGIVSAPGLNKFPQCTLPYAPPEVVVAALDGKHVTVRPSHDIWSLGVVAYEAITQQRALAKRDDIAPCARGTASYPWELPVKQQPAAWRSSRLRPLVLPCLARDPRQRPRASAVLSAVGQLMDSSA